MNSHTYYKVAFSNHNKNTFNKVNGWYIVGAYNRTSELGCNIILQVLSIAKQHHPWRLTCDV